MLYSLTPHNTTIRWGINRLIKNKPTKRPFHTLTKEISADFLSHSYPFCISINNKKDIPLILRSQWRIQDFPQEGAPTIKVGVPTYYFSQFFPQKLHKHEKNGYRGGGKRPWHPLGSINGSLLTTPPPPILNLLIILD